MRMAALSGGALDFLPIVKRKKRGGAVTPPKGNRSLCGSYVDVARYAPDAAALCDLNQASRRARGRQDRAASRWPSASLDRRCARHGTDLQAGTEKRRFSRTEKPCNLLERWPNDLEFIWPTERSADQTVSVAAEARRLNQAVDPRRRAGRGRANGHVRVERHTWHDTWDRFEWRHVPSDRLCCAIGRAQRSA